MRYVLALVLFAGTFVVIACSSSDDKQSSSSSGTIAPLGSGKGDDDDDGAAKTASCSGVKSLDCAKLTAHAKEAGCTKFDEKQWTDDCEAENCGTPTACATQLKAFGDCLQNEPATCDEGGGVAKDVPACKGKEGDLTNCLLQNQE